MYITPTSAPRWLARVAGEAVPESGAYLVSASPGLRERVLRGVRGNHTRRSRLAALTASVLALLVGLGLGGLLGFILAPHGRGTASAGAIVRQFGSNAELIVNGLSEPPPDETYEVWLKRPNLPPQPTDVLFTVTRSGSATVAVPGALSDGVREVLVSREPRGGSTTPTSPPILRLRIPPAS